MVGTCVKRFAEDDNLGEDARIYSRGGFDRPGDWEVVRKLFDLFGRPNSEFVRDGRDNGTGVVLYSPLV